ncbi:RrF2 family transcriptional regulator [Falsarthrobacter nasiphocae]|uniref:Rrf2 family nitric oxide-sensitive transcriptional repressor n=1 Tax=Falsarthrobacter nasiphocae TaxID=189863 RepID=A0AAE3YE99_9MICC|nr:Rrf2 family transcriptional regulator [Falsarthrobacter nasiphocae]MDR6891794.1 Rrf2 family nitric oxide-sensitive transcriptional repressor [Falsarthrobacter nasiphocae]
MRLNVFSDLCLRIVLALGEHEPQTGRQLAERVGLPYNHVSKAVIRLRELGLLDVQRGRNGGASLSPAGRTTTVGRLLRDLDERPNVAACCEPGRPACPLLGRCGLQHVLNRAREEFYRALDDVVITSLSPASKTLIPIPPIPPAAEPAQAEPTQAEPSAAGDLDQQQSRM